MLHLIFSPRSEKGVDFWRCNTERRSPRFNKKTHDQNIAKVTRIVSKMCEAFDSTDDSVRLRNVYKKTMNDYLEVSSAIRSNVGCLDVENDVCAICLEEKSIEPVFCMLCLKVVGCETCIRQWVRQGDEFELLKCLRCRRSCFKILPLIHHASKEPSSEPSEARLSLNLEPEHQIEEKEEEQLPIILEEDSEEDEDEEESDESDSEEEETIEAEIVGVDHRDTVGEEHVREFLTRRIPEEEDEEVRANGIQRRNRVMPRQWAIRSGHIGGSLSRPVPYHGGPTTHRIHRSNAIPPSNQMDGPDVERPGPNHPDVINNQPTTNNSRLADPTRPTRMIPEDEEVRANDIQRRSDGMPRQWARRSGRIGSLSRPIPSNGGPTSHRSQRYHPYQPFFQLPTDVHNEFNRSFRDQSTITSFNAAVYNPSELPVPQRQVHQQ